MREQPLGAIDHDFLNMGANRVAGFLAVCSDELPPAKPAELRQFRKRGRRPFRPDALFDRFELRGGKAAAPRAMRVRGAEHTCCLDQQGKREAFEIKQGGKPGIGHLSRNVEKQVAYHLRLKRYTLR